MNRRQAVTALATLPGASLMNDLAHAESQPDFTVTAQSLTASLNNAVWSHDGRYIAASGLRFPYQSVVMVVDTKTKTKSKLFELELPHDEKYFRKMASHMAVVPLSFSADGETLYAGQDRLYAISMRSRDITASYAMVGADLVAMVKDIRALPDGTIALAYEAMAWGSPMPALRYHFSLLGKDLTPMSGRQVDTRSPEQGLPNAKGLVERAGRIDRVLLTDTHVIVDARISNDLRRITSHLLSDWSIVATLDAPMGDANFVGTLGLSSGRKALRVSAEGTTNPPTTNTILRSMNPTTLQVIASWVADRSLSFDTYRPSVSDDGKTFATKKTITTVRDDVPSRVYVYRDGGEAEDVGMDFSHFSACAFLHHGGKALVVTDERRFLFLTDLDWAKTGCSC